MVSFLPVSAVEVIVASVVGFVLGWLWYSPMLFGKQWMKASGISEKQIAASKKKGMAGTIVVGFISTLVMGFVLAQFLAYSAASSLMDGVIVGVLTSVGFVLTTIGGGVLWEGRSMQWFYINAGHSIVTLAVMGAIIAVMG